MLNNNKSSPAFIEEVAERYSENKKRDTAR